MHLEIVILNFRTCYAMIRLEISFEGTKVADDSKAEFFMSIFEFVFARVLWTQQACNDPYMYYKVFYPFEK